MPVDAGTILRVVAELIVPQTTVMQNVFYCKFNDTGPSNENQDVVDDARDWCDAIYGELTAQMKSTIDSGEVKVYQWDTVGLDWDELGSAFLTVDFTNVDDMLPHGVAAIITGRTFNPDVSGRKFFGGFCEDQQNVSLIGAAAAIALGLAGVEWLTSFTGVATGSTFHTGVWSVAQSAFRQFVDILIVNAVMGYQRRRKPGVGI